MRLLLECYRNITESLREWVKRFRQLIFLNKRHLWKINRRKWS